MGAYWDLLTLGRPPPPGRPPGSLLFSLPSNPSSSLWWFCWFSVLTGRCGGDTPGWHGALAVLQSSPHCLVM